MIAAIGVLLSLLLVSCEEFFFEVEPGTTPIEIFDQVWTFADQEYSFFELKGVDWDAARDTYRPQVRSDMSDQELFDLLADMLYELQDGHVNLVSDFDRSRYWQWYLMEPPNYDYSVLERDYFQGQEQYVGPFIVHEFRDVGAPDSEAVGYVHYRSFGSTVGTQDMNYIIDKFSDYKGIIFDVRNNGGGATANVLNIANRFTDTAVSVAAEREKMGPGHDEFGPLYQIVLSPPEDATTYTKPVFVLTNRGCYSATNMFVAYVQPLEHVTILGRPTGGGGGTPAFTLLSNGWQLRVSSTQRFTLDGLNIEGGVSPLPGDLVSSTEADLALGIDTILETAISRIKSL